MLKLPWSKKKNELIVLVATRQPTALEALGKFTAAVTQREAFSTGGVYKALAGCHLVITDLEELLPSDGITLEALKETLVGLEVPVATGVELAKAPEVWEARALAAAGVVEKLPPKAIAFASFSGGVGKTTFALDLTRFVAERFRVPVMVVEIGYGVSALRALTNNPDLPDFYKVLTQAATPATWNNVGLLPMDYQTARLAVGRQDEIRNLFTRLKGDHVLTVFDVNPAHPFWTIAEALTDEVYAVATPRPDALANALAFLGEKAEDAPRRQLIVNRVRSLADRAACMGLQPAAELPEVDRPERLNGDLARRLMPVIYPGWRDSKVKGKAVKLPAPRTAAAHGSDSAATAVRQPSA